MGRPRKNLSEIPEEEILAASENIDVVDDNIQDVVGSPAYPNTPSAVVQANQSRIVAFRQECNRVYTEIVRDFDPKTVMDREKIALLAKLLVRQERLYDMLSDFTADGFLMLQSHSEEDDSDPASFHFKVSSEADRVAGAISRISNDLRKTCPVAAVKTIDVSTSAGRHEALMDTIQSIRAGASTHGK
jgi:hypothetical protein